MVKGGTLHDVTVGDCLELSLGIDDRTLRSNKAMGFYQLLYQMGVDTTYQQVAMVDFDMSQYHDAGLTAGASYMYMITAMNQAGTASSNEITFVAP